ncbi:MAG: TRAP transporter small permease [Pseudomonadota bacterium]
MIEHERRGWVDQINWRLSRITYLFPALIVTMIVYEVFMRYVLEKPTIWVNEMSLWMGGWIYLSAGVYAMQQRSHIRITLLYDIVPLWLRRVFDIVSAVLIVVWAFTTIWGGYNEAVKAFLTWERYDSAWAPPIPAISQPLILITMVFVTVQAVSNLIMDWGKEDQPGIADEEWVSEIEEIRRAQSIDSDSRD